MPPKTKTTPRAGPPRRPSGEARPKSVSRHVRAGLVFPVSRIVSHLKKTGRLIGMRRDAGVYFSAGLEGLARALLKKAQLVARLESKEKETEGPVRAETHHLITAFDRPDCIRDLAPLCGITPQPLHAAHIASDIARHREQKRKEREAAKAKRDERKAKLVAELKKKKKQQKEKEKEQEEGEASEASEDEA